MNRSLMNPQIMGWLEENGIFNALIEVDSVTLRVNRTQGLMNAASNEGWPKLEPPDWLQQIAREYLADRSDR